MRAGAENPLQYPLLRHLQLHSATGRSVAALTITAWARAAGDALGQDAAHPVATGASLAEPTSGFPYQEVLQVLTALLAAPAVLQNADGSVQPFAEVASTYSIMRQHAQVWSSRFSHVLIPFLFLPILPVHSPLLSVHKTSLHAGVLHSVLAQLCCQAAQFCMRSSQSVKCSSACTKALLSNADRLQQKVLHPSDPEPCVHAASTHVQCPGFFNTVC